MDDMRCTEADSCAVTAGNGSRFCSTEFKDCSQHDVDKWLRGRGAPLVELLDVNGVGGSRGGGISEERLGSRETTDPVYVQGTSSVLQVLICCRIT